MLQLPELHLDMSDNTQLVLGAVICLTVVGVITGAYFPRSESGLPLPPSPPTWRFQGHFLPPRKYVSLIHFYVNTDHVQSLISSFLTIAEWIDEYGPLVTMRSGTKKIVIIGRHKVCPPMPACLISKCKRMLQAAADIMEKQGGIPLE
jgi:hypothetical protein